MTPTITKIEGNVVTLSFPKLRRKLTLSGEIDALNALWNDEPMPQRPPFNASWTEPIFENSLDRRASEEYEALLALGLLPDDNKRT